MNEEIFNFQTSKLIFLGGSTHIYFKRLLIFIAPYVFQYSKIRNKKYNMNRLKIKKKYLTGLEAYVVFNNPKQISLSYCQTKNQIKTSVKTGN